MRQDMLPANAVLALNRISPYIRETPFEYSAYFSRLCDADVWLKLENLQITGSFKLRGAFNKLLSLSDAEREAGCVAASSGNHGAAVACAMQRLGVSGPVFVPETASSTKVEAIRRAGGDVRFFGTDGLDTEQHARQFAIDEGMTYLSPYNDLEVIAGQGSCGVEMSRQVEHLDAVFIAVGGGGLISGAGSFLKSVFPDIDMIGCQPAASAVMAASVQAGRILDMPSEKTLSDGTAGGIEADSLTFDICRSLVTDYQLVSEDHIAEAMREFIDAHSMLLEGAAGVALAGLKQRASGYRKRKLAVIVCGGNISRQTLKSIL